MLNFREKYIEFLNGTTFYNGKTHNRVRHPKKYEFESYCKHKRFYNVDFDKEHHRVFLWSDQHFGHKNIIKYTNRPYQSVEQMNTQLIENYNNTVGQNDICFWLGDVAFLGDLQANEILRKCNGYKILIIGNHDFKGKTLKKLDVDEYHLCYQIQTIDVNMLLTHFPIEEIPVSYFNVHGHTHDREEQSKQHINVSVEHINYTPVKLTDVISLAQNRLLENL